MGICGTMISGSRLWGALPILLAVMLVWPELAVRAQSPAPCATGPLSETCLIELITGKVAEPRIVSLIKTRGVAFQMDSAIEQRLKRAGATTAVLAAARENALKPKPAPPQPPSQPNPSTPPESPAKVALRAEVELWSSIKESNNAELFQDYVRRYPNGQFSAPAQVKIRDLTIPPLRSRIQQAVTAADWERAATDLEQLLKLSPGEDVQAWSAAIDKGRQQKTETDLWSRIKASDDAFVFEDYLRKYPAGQFAASARQRLVELRIAAWRTPIERAISERRWSDAETNINELVLTCINE